MAIRIGTANSISLAAAITSREIRIDSTKISLEPIIRITIQTEDTNIDKTETAAEWQFLFGSGRKR